MNCSKFIFIFLCGIQFGCVSQKTDAINMVEQDKVLASIYQKFYKNRHDYGASEGEARDTILFRFRNTLKNTLDQKISRNYPYPLLSEKIGIINSDDKKIRIFSWDELNGGTWHIYNSMYQIAIDDSVYSGTFDNDFIYSDASYFKIQKLENDKYLVMGYGTHGAGEEFYILRLVSIDQKKLSDCTGCFDGKDQMIWIKPRETDEIPVYDSLSQTLQFPEYKENEETGFLTRTGNMIILHYQDDSFVAKKK